ncbi:MAG: alkaline phosphatase family protein [Bdellovibrionia bacterium]
MLAVASQSCNGSAGDSAQAAVTLSATPSTNPNQDSQTADPAQKKVFVIVLENTDASSAIKQPFLGQLAAKGALLSNYSAITNPSQPNYIGLTSAGTWGIADDSNHTVDVRHIGNLVEEKGLTWKSYAESYPGGCNLSASIGTYVRKHEPFLSYKNVQTDATRCAKVVNSSQLATDIAAGTVPNYSFYVPDMNNDGHDTGVAYADNWLSNTFSSLINDPKFMKDNLFIVTFDEGSQANQVYTVLYGDAVIPGSTSSQATGHYGLLATIEQYLGLGSLGQADATAQPITGIWK